MIKEITFEEVNPYWMQLWPWHTSETIYRHSNMLYGGGFFGLDYTPEVTYFAVLCDDKIVGVNSGHTTPENLYRSRGLWVDPQYRGRAFGIMLLDACVRKSESLGCAGTWSFPRETSQKTYQSAGFKMTGQWTESENNIKNAFFLRKNY